MKPLDDITRLRDEYEDRKRRYFGSDMYSWLNQANLFSLQQRQRAILLALKKKGFKDLAELSIMDVGCGTGGVLIEYLQFGALPERLYGVDLLFDRMFHAHNMLPVSGLANADGRALPFPGRSFDLVIQSTAISSILNQEHRHDFCSDMLRVVKHDGLILSYDFWLNPLNPQTRGVRPKEIKGLFPHCNYEFQRITLAPPIARRLATISWGLCLFLESLKIFNTHYLVAISPAGSQ